MSYFRPILSVDPHPPKSAYWLGGGWCWFTHVEHLRRDHAPEIVPASELDAGSLARLTGARGEIAGISFERPRIMGILNVTPDSFSDGGRFQGEAGVRIAQAMRDQGADLIDVGAESTRPGAAFVPAHEEIARLAPVLPALKDMPVSLDTRKAEVAAFGLEQGVAVINDVSGLSFDGDMATTVAGSSAGLCVMHAQGTPETMQANPHYDDVLLDVYDGLAASLDLAERAGISRERIMVDPGIGFGKTLDHNLTLLRRVALFHSLGAPILLGVSRKKMIGTLSGEARAEARGPGSLALGVAAIAQAVQMLRVHDVAMTAQGLAMASALWQTGDKKDMAE